MRQIVKEIVKNLWNGKANIIQFNRSMDIDDFLLHDIKNAIQEADKNCFFFQASPENTRTFYEYEAQILTSTFVASRLPLN